MNKELEAFNGICCNTNQSYPDFQKQRKIVETALKRLEEIDNSSSMRIENILPHIFDDNEQLKKRLDETQHRLWEKQKVIDKQDKILQIIKEKVMPLVDLDYQPKKECKKYRVYDNELYQYTDLTKEEYDLLKEVLL